MRRCLELSTKLDERIAELEARLADLEARLPKHSTPMAMMLELEELEDELAELKAEASLDPSQ
jgi:uncharacterized protein YceH (UPF0502 family)